jgi:hypothetical protein
MACVRTLVTSKGTRRCARSGFRRLTTPWIPHARAQRYHVREFVVNTVRPRRVLAERPYRRSLQLQPPHPPEREYRGASRMQNVKLRSRFRRLANRCAPKLPRTGAHRANELGRPHQPRRPRTRERHRAGDRSDPSRVRYLWNDSSFSWPSSARVKEAFLMVAGRGRVDVRAA